MPKQTILVVVQGLALIAVALYVQHRFDAIDQRLEQISSARHLTAPHATIENGSDAANSTTTTLNQLDIHAIAQAVWRQQPSQRNVATTNAASSTTVNQRPATTADNEQLQSTMTHVQTLIASGTLRRQDVGQLHSELALMPPAHQEQVLSALTQALNSGVLRAEPGAGF